jgi:tRNA (uracil-5-)-methyltransferase TRM9
MWSKWILQRGFKYPDETIVRFVAKNYTDYKKRKKLKVLVDGFASGRHVIFFAKEGFDTYGIDIEKIAIKNCKKWLNIENLSAHIQQANALVLPYEEDYFDIVIDFGMIEHFIYKDRKEAFAQIVKVLKKNGVFIFVAKNAADFYYKQGKEIERNTFILNTYFLENMPTHFYFKKDLLAELRDFKKINLECSIHYRDNLKMKLSNWYAFCYK